MDGSAADSDNGYRMRVELDKLDRRIVHALHLAGRAPFSRIAEVLGVSDQTVARRYRRLRAAGLVRVVASPSAHAFGQDSWLLRLRCTPDAAIGIADALARQPNTSWITLVSGGTEIHCVIRTRGRGETESLLLRRLPRTPRVLSVSAHKLLHTFYGGPRSWSGKAQALTKAEAAELAPPAPDAARRVEPLPGDEELFAALAEDGRAGFAELAAATGWSETTVRRRLDELLRSGAMHFEADVDNVALGGVEHARLWVSVAPAHLAAVGEAVARHPETAFAGAMTGNTNLVTSVVCADAQELYAYLTTRIAALDGITSIETSPVIRTVKREGALLPPGAVRTGRQDRGRQPV